MVRTPSTMLPLGGKVCRPAGMSMITGEAVRLT